jgi:hypothetical protein
MPKALEDNLHDAPESKENHFIAQFHLAYWCGADGKLTVYSREQGRVVTSSRSPRSTGFEPNLYAYEFVSAEKRHSIEDDFFRQLDSRAAPTFKKILKGGFSNLIADERSDLTRYVLSLLARHPDAVAHAKTLGNEMAMAAFSRDPEVYEAVRQESSPPPLIPNFGLHNLPAVITDPKLGERVFRMPWWVHDVRHASTDLLLSDRPCILKGNARDGNCTIVLPVSPTMVLFICNWQQQIQFLREMPESRIVKMVNLASARYAARRVYGTGPHHLPLVEKYLRN